MFTFFGYYIGNYPSLTNDKIRKICKILNSIYYDLIKVHFLVMYVF